jgi:hypothetical protein
MLVQFYPVGMGMGGTTKVLSSAEAGANRWTSASDPITLIGHRTGLIWLCWLFGLAVLMDVNVLIWLC